MATRADRTSHPMSHRPSLGQTLADWRRRPDSARHVTFVEYLAIHAPLVFAHHPPTDSLTAHTFQWRGLYLCRGCLMAAAGVLVSAPVALMTRWVAHTSTEHLALALFGMLVPTIVTTVWRGPRTLRDASRFVLGMAVGSSLAALFLLESWAVRGTIVLTFLLARFVLSRHRHIRMNQNTQT